MVKIVHRIESVNLNLYRLAFFYVNFYRKVFEVQICSTNLAYVPNNAYSWNNESTINFELDMSMLIYTTYSQFPLVMDWRKKISMKYKTNIFV